jgi:hypothetical protein
LVYDSGLAGEGLRSSDRKRRLLSRNGTNSGLVTGSGIEAMIDSSRDCPRIDRNCPIRGEYTIKDVDKTK